MSSLISKNPAVAVIIAIVALGAAGTMIVRSQRASTVGAPTQAWYYSLQSGELFGGPYDGVPPVPGPGGGEGVRAYVYSCGVCSAADQFIAYLETYPAESKAKLAAAKASNNYDDAGLIMTTERQVAALPAEGDAPQWINAASPQAQHLVSQHLTKCGDVAVVACDP